MTAPWSPSRAREAARAALCRYRTAPKSWPAPDLWCGALLALLDREDARLDSPAALRLWLDGHDVPAPELRELLEEGR